MDRMIDCVNMQYRNGVFLMTPRKSCETDLVMLGFNGTEKWYRLQCVCDSRGCWDFIATICNSKGKSVSWHWGFGGYTLISEELRVLQNQIVKACQDWCRMHSMTFPAR